MILTGKTCSSGRKPCLNSALSITTLTCTGPVSRQDLRGERSVTNHPNHGWAFAVLGNGDWLYLMESSL
jgi:hypothetical protein